MPYQIRKLRASITDLSEENTRDLAEVESRGLSGGIKLVRGLRDELRDIEHNLNETKSAERKSSLFKQKLERKSLQAAAWLQVVKMQSLARLL